MTRSPKSVPSADTPAAAKATRKRAAKPKSGAAKQPAVVLALVPDDPAQNSADLGDKSQQPMLRKKAFIARVIAASGAKKKDAQNVIEATLAALGAAFSAGEAVALPPLGRARVSRQIDKSGGEMLVIKLRRGGEKAARTGKKTSDETLAEAND
jgi:hypothetical protein